MNGRDRKTWLAAGQPGINAGPNTAGAETPVNGRKKTNGLRGRKGSTMPTEIATLITVVGGVIAAGATYLFTKWREREAEWRKDKREYYKAFMASCSANVEGDSTPEGKLAFNRATNDLSLIAPQRVIEALIAYREETSISNPDRRQDRHDQLLSRLLYEMRRDLAMSPKDDEDTFRVILWASGVTSAEKESLSQRSKRA
ncbi:MAG: hypothetical protein WCB27_26075 [Thermoguttaceae bacterium]